jgi:hypothetical protein
MKPLTRSRKPLPSSGLAMMPITPSQIAHSARKCKVAARDARCDDGADAPPRQHDRDGDHNEEDDVSQRMVQGLRHDRKRGRFPPSLPLFWRAHQLGYRSSHTFSARERAESRRTTTDVLGFNATAPDQACSMQSKEAEPKQLHNSSWSVEHSEARTSTIDEMACGVDVPRIKMLSEGIHVGMAALYLSHAPTREPADVVP